MVARPEVLERRMANWWQGEGQRCWWQAKSTATSTKWEEEQGTEGRERGPKIPKLRRYAGWRTYLIAVVFVGIWTGGQAQALDEGFGREQRCQVVARGYEAFGRGRAVQLGAYVTGDRMPLEWLWTQFLTTSDLHEAYPDFQPGRLHAQGLIPTASADLAFPRLLGQTADMDTKLVQADFGIATYNVGSITSSDGTAEDNILKSHEYLRQQAHSHGIDCLFLQETRARTSNMVTSGTHIRLVSECLNKKGGSEIWLRRRDSRGTDRGLRQRDVLVLASDPEFICARVRWSFGSFLLLSAHAPHSGRAAIDVEKWWQQLSHMIQRFHHRSEEWLVVGIDANAHFASEDQPWIGPLGTTPKSNVPAGHFAAFLRAHSLFLPSTFEEYHTGPCFTWRVNSDQPGARCDYVCLPLEWKTLSPRSQNLPELDAGTASYDHTPVGVWCLLSFKRTRRHKPQFDVSKVAEAMRTEGKILQQQLAGIPWKRDVHQHAAEMADMISVWLAEKCPRAHQGPRASYISAKTWELRQLRLWYARSVRNIHQCYSHHHIRMALYAWRDGVTLTTMCDDGLHIAFAIQRQRRLLLQGLRSTRRLLRHHLRHDRTMYLEQVVDTAMMDQPNALHRHLRSIGVVSKNKRSSLQPLPCLRDQDGTLVTSFSQWAEVWRKNFEQQEDGRPRTREELFSTCLERQRWEQHCSALPDWTQLPTLHELEAVMRQTRTGKAFFDDLIPGEVLHYGAGVLAPVVFPLLLKQWIFNREPLLFKGGLLVSAFKKGDPKDPSNYRSLLISPTLGKAFHRILRRDLMEVFEPRSLPLQLGGRPKIAVTQAAHALHLFLHDQRCAGRPCAILFLDIRNAFYRLFRQQLTNTGILSRSVEELFDSLNLPPEAFREFCSHLQGCTATADMDTPPFLEGQVRELLNTTWFVVSGSEVFTEARKGSRPGDSVADLLFTIAFRHLLAKVSQELHECGVLLQLSWSGERRPFQPDGQMDMGHHIDVLGPVWADDLAVLMTAESSEVLLNNVQRAAGTLFDTLLLNGMQPNLGPSKTELLLELRGPNSTPLRKQIAMDEFQLTTTSRYLQDKVRIVGSYRHLGTWVQINGKLGKEMNCKAAIGHSTMTKYKAPIFANKAMHLDRKVQLFQSLVMSAFLFNSPIWMITRKRDVQKLHSCIMSLYRRVALGHWGIVARRWKDETVQSRLSLPNPLHQLHVHRLRYLQHLVRAGDPTLWAILQQRDYWWKLVDVSLDWLRSNLLRRLPEGSCMVDWPSWEALLLRPGRRWNNMLKKALLHATLQNRRQVAWMDLHEEFCQIIVNSGLYQRPTVEKEWDMHACVRCRQTFLTNSAWSVHAFRKHGRVTPARQFTVGTMCEFCLKKFHDHMGLVNHVGNNPTCYWQYQARGHRAEIQPSLNSRKEIRSRSDLRCPVYRMDGPTPIPLPLSDPQPTVEQQELLDAWEEVRQTYATSVMEISAIREALRFATLQTTLPIFEILYVARSWRLHLNRQGILTEDDAFSVALTKFVNEFTVPWLFADTTLPVTTVDDPLATLDEWLRWDCPTAVVPRPLGFKQVMVAHLFSGRRRMGDFQDWMSQVSFGTEHPTLSLSVDIIFSEKWGNLLNPATAALFFDAIRAGLLIAVLAGPPCETWSIARQRGLYMDDGPKPLRSLEALSGFQLLTIREVRQLCLGNELLGIALLVAVLLWIHGGLCILEHPCEPSMLSAPSIWRMSATRFLLQQDTNKRVRVYQGNFGAKSPKPTDFLITHAPCGVVGLFRSHWSTARLPVATSIGKTKDGQYKTASLKEYPEALSKAFSAVVVAHVQSRGFDPAPLECPEGFLSKVGALIAQLDFNVQEMGPDYHPTSRA